MPRELFLDSKVKTADIQIFRGRRHEDSLNLKFSLLVEVLKNDSHECAVQVIERISHLVGEEGGAVLRAQAHCFYTNAVRLILYTQGQRDAMNRVMTPDFGKANQMWERARNVAPREAIVWDCAFVSF